jgi:hypothetical protein
MTTMKTFKRFRTLEQLRAACAERNWPVNSDLHDRQGHDHISFHFDIGAAVGVALYNTFNGRLHGQLANGEAFSAANDKHEKEPWFQTLLEVVYE